MIYVTGESRVHTKLPTIEVRRDAKRRHSSCRAPRGALEKEVRDESSTLVPDVGKGRVIVVRLRATCSSGDARAPCAILTTRLTMIVGVRRSSSVAL